MTAFLPYDLPEVAVASSLLRQLRLIAMQHERALRASALAEAPRRAADELRKEYTHADAPDARVTRTVVAAPITPRRVESAA